MTVGPAKILSNLEDNEEQNEGGEYKIFHKRELLVEYLSIRCR